MTAAPLQQRVAGVLSADVPLDANFVSLRDTSAHDEQRQTNDAFSEKWRRVASSEEKQKAWALQKRWYLTLYGFGTEEALSAFLRDKAVILDAGCGLGYKAAWFAELSPQSLVIGMDYSDAARLAAGTYAAVPNLFFIQGDIAEPIFKTRSIDYVSCDQVIMHTQQPDRTFAELARVTSRELACYFYAKKALPRELLDDYFRTRCADMTSDELWEMSEQLTELGRRLSAIDARIESPDIPALGIKGGEYDIQRFIYWNFLKCFWNEELGWDNSVAGNFDWYSPSNARRFSREEVKALAAANAMQEVSFHEEEACYSGRWAKGPLAG